MFKRIKSIWDVLFNHKSIYEHCLECEQVDPTLVWCNGIKYKFINSFINFIINNKEIYIFYTNSVDYFMEDRIHVNDNVFNIKIHGEIDFDVTLLKPAECRLFGIEKLTVSIHDLQNHKIINVKLPDIIFNEHFSYNSTLTEMERHFSLYNQFVSGNEMIVRNDLVHPRDIEYISFYDWSYIIGNCLINTNIFEDTLKFKDDKKFYYSYGIEPTYENMKSLSNHDNFNDAMYIAEEYMTDRDFTRLSNLIKLKGTFNENS